MSESPQETLVDTRGLPCPQPVVAARKALLAPGAAAVRVLVDNQVSVENIRRMARSQGWNAAVEGQGAEVRMLLTRLGADPQAAAEAPATAGRVPPATPEPKPPTVVLVSSEFFGTGDEALGRILTRAFIKTLGELDPLPAKVIFVNSGVRLTTEGSELISDLVALAGRGVEVVSCGTCLDFYKLKESLRVGTVTNMYDIASSLCAAERIVRP